MPILHDAGVADSVCARIRALRPDAERRWGSMTADQMLWHVNTALSSALVQSTAKPHKLPLPAPILKFVVLNMRWPRGAPTNPEYLARSRHDFAKERDRCLQLIETVTKKQLSESWPAHPSFGAMTGRQWSKLQAKHLEHHLTQFGA